MSVTPSETEDRLTSDVTPHYATLLHGDVWGVSYLPGKPLSRSAATTALVLAEMVVKGASANDGLMRTFARELGMGPAEAVRLASTPLPHDGHAVGDDAERGQG